MFRAIVIFSFWIAATCAAHAQSPAEPWNVVRDAISKGGGVCPQISERLPDYTAAAMREREEGLAVVGLCVSAEGTPNSFEILNSSGIPRIDIMTALWACGKRFQPGLDAKGNAIPTCAAVAEFDWKLMGFPTVADFISRQPALPEDVSTTAEAPVR